MSGEIHESAGWIVVLIITIIFIAIWLIFGKWIVEWVVKNMDWKVVARCASEHC